MAGAEVTGAGAIVLGVNVLDSSGYPDCRPEWLAAMQEVARLGTRAGVEGRPIEIHAPLVRMSKAQIIRAGTALGVDYGLTHSCYDPDAGGAACGSCDACILRRDGFEAAGVPDPTRYCRP
jgi:7-cyano-7-deazaguanine synthase